jgi:hypothetical protein
MQWKQKGQKKAKTLKIFAFFALFAFMLADTSCVSLREPGLINLSSGQSGLPDADRRVRCAVGVLMFGADLRVRCTGSLCLVLARPRAFCKEYQLK